MTHTAKFDLKTQGGVCAGQQWICDHDQPIARLQNDIVEQPEQNLRYFNGILKPVELREIRLAPASDRSLAAFSSTGKWGQSPQPNSIL